MVIPGFLEPVVQYYLIYGPILIMVTLVLAITYTFISNFAAVRSAYTCTSLKNVLNGNVGKCFSSRIGSTCSKSDIGYTHGWCNDTDNYGPLRGTRTGPYAVKCSDWIWSKSDCPPDTCGKISGKEWGWCADKGVQRAMRGQACGPFQGTCDTWVWNAKACPEQCGSPSCTDDSCICSMLKARYVILKRVDNTATSLAVKDIEVYDSDGYRIKSGVRPTLWPQFGDVSTYGPQNISVGTGVSKTEASKDAYIQLDLGEDKAIGRVIIKNVSDSESNRMIGSALILRKNDNKTALYRKITEVKSVYDIPIGKAKPVIPEPEQGKEAATGAVSVAAAIVGTAAAPAALVRTPRPEGITDKDKADAAAAKATINVKPVTPKSPWEKITGGLKHISVNPEWTWGVNSKNEIYKCKTPCKTPWTKVSGGLVQIDVGKTEVWGVNGNGEIYRRPVDGSGSWTQMKGRLKYVSSGPTDLVWGVNSSDNIYMCVPGKGKRCYNEWKQMSGSLKQLSVGEDEVWGVNRSNEIYKRPVNGTGKWTQVPGKLKHVSVGKDEIIGVNTDNEIYTCGQPCTGKWNKIEGKLRQVDTANRDNTVGVNDAGEIYMRV